MTEDREIEHFEKIREDVRDEIKKRIEQRDKFSIQLTIALGLIVSVSFASDKFGKVMIAAPLVSIYFTMLILYSYKIHTVLAAYLKDAIEPELALFFGTPLNIEWETYYNNTAKKVPGIRQQFFLWAMWVVCLTSLTYLWLAQRKGFEITLIVVSILYLVTSSIITLSFTNKLKLSKILKIIINVLSLV